MKDEYHRFYNTKYPQNTKALGISKYLSKNSCNHWPKHPPNVIKQVNNALNFFFIPLCFRNIISIGAIERWKRKTDTD